MPLWGLEEPMRTYHNPNRECWQTGFGGNFNRLPGDTDLPKCAAGVGDMNGYNTDYLVPWIQGIGSEPTHIRTTMPAGKLFNDILDKDIENTDTKGSWEGFPLRSLDFQNALAFLMILKGEIQHLNVNDMSIGSAGVLSETRNIYNDRPLLKDLTGWYLTGREDVLNTQTGPRFGDIGELARDVYGDGGTNEFYGYINSSGTVVSNSKNTYVGITARSDSTNDLGVPRAVGLINRVEKIEQYVADIDASLLTDQESISDSKTVKLFMNASSAWSAEFSTGSLDAGSPTAIFSAVSDSNMVHVSLQLLRAPWPNVPINFDDSSNWIVKLRGTARASISLSHQLQGSEYIATWTIRMTGLASGTATNGTSPRIPALMESCGASITTSWASNTYQVSFKTATGLNNSPIFSDKQYTTRISAVLSS